MRADPAATGEIPPEMVRKWNWGAFILSNLWPFWHGVPWLGVAALACSLTSFLVVPAIIGLGLSVYLGMKGNAIAAQRRCYASPEEFVAVERAWERWGFGVLIVGVALYAAAVFLAPVLHLK